MKKRFSKISIHSLGFRIFVLLAVMIVLFCALAQAKQFMEVADITGIILTKLDGTAKGGIAVAIQSELGIPVKYVGIGEKIDDLQKFDANDFVNALFKRNEALTENE